MLQLLDKQLGYTSFLRKLYVDVLPPEPLKKAPLKRAEKEVPLPTEIIIDGMKRM